MFDRFKAGRLVRKGDEITYFGQEEMAGRSTNLGYRKTSFLFDRFKAGRLVRKGDEITYFEQEGIAGRCTNLGRRKTSFIDLLLYPAICRKSVSLFKPRAGKKLFYRFKAGRLVRKGDEITYSGARRNGGEI